MTEAELRAKVVSTAKSYYGVKQGTAAHKALVDTYNAHTPLAMGYKLTYQDPWCAGFVSAVAILCEVTDIIPTHVNCGAQIAQFKAMGRWMEDDAYKPQAGDIIYYDWSDSGVGDNTTAPDHVGMVVSVTGTTIRVIEGNMSRAVGYRSIQVNGRYIRGYGLPDYASAASGVASEPVQVDKPDLFSTPKTYKNGSTDEICYADTALTVKTGSLNPWEECACLGIVDGRYLVYYQVDGTDYYKTGFVEYDGGVSA